MANKLLKTLNFGGTDIYDLAPKWENVRNRPFGYETATGGDTLKWDGKINGLEAIWGVLFNVHDAYPKVVDGTIELNANGTVTSYPFTQSDVQDKGEGVQHIMIYGDVKAVIVPPTAVGVNIDGIVYGKSGVYLRKSGVEYVSSLTINGCEDFAGVKTLDNKYLPKHLRFDSEGIETKYLPEHLQFGVEDMQTIDLLPQTELMMIDEGQFALMNTIEDMVANETYLINYNGVDYSCVANEVDLGGGALVLALGNKSMLGGEDTGEPFTIAVVPTDLIEMLGVGVLFYALDGTTSVTLTISALTEKIKKLDNKYLNLDWKPVINKSPSVLFEDETRFTSNSYNQYDEIQFEILKNEPYFIYYSPDKGSNADYECYGKTVKGVYSDETTTYKHTIHWLGNASLSYFKEGEKDTGEPFLFEYIEDELGGILWFRLYANNGNSYATISVQGFKFTYDKMPAKFMPDALETLKMRYIVLYDGYNNPYRLSIDTLGELVVTKIE